MVTHVILVAMLPQRRLGSRKLEINLVPYDADTSARVFRSIRIKGDEYVVSSNDATSLLEAGWDGES